jgi:hypothetical protein
MFAGRWASETSPPRQSRPIGLRQFNTLHDDDTHCATQQKIMAPGQKVYPRATVKKIVKAHSNLNISKNADVLVSLPRTCDALLLTRLAWLTLSSIVDLSRLRPLYANVGVPLSTTVKSCLHKLTSLIQSHQRICHRGKAIGRKNVDCLERQESNSSAYHSPRRWPQCKQDVANPHSIGCACQVQGLKQHRQVPPFQAGPGDQHDSDTGRHRRTANLTTFLAYYESRLVADSRWLVRIPQSVG